MERMATSPAALHLHGRELRHTSGVVVPLPSSVQFGHLSYNILVNQFVREFTGTAFLLLTPYVPFSSCSAGFLGCFSAAGSLHNELSGEVDKYF